jgi:hypothetical protein
MFDTHYCFMAHMIKGKTKILVNVYPYCSHGKDKGINID